jgi:acyl dehydratase
MEDVLQRLKGQAGQEIGVSSWWEVTQERIDAFADATDDHQFIHVNPELAAQTPYGGTIAHGFLTLSMSVPMSTEIQMDVGNPLMAINYGLDRARFPSPVPVDSKIRLRVTLDEVSEVSGGIQMKQTMTTEIEGQEKPAMVAERLTRLFY